MHRKLLKTLLTNYNSKYQEENFFKQQMLEFLDVCSNCFERSCSVGHFTASAWLLDNTKTKVLLMHHAKFDRWLQLSGHCDGNHDVLQVAIKEAHEESGITDPGSIVPLSNDIFDLDIHLTPQIKSELPHYHFDIRFLLQAQGNNNIKLNHESKDLKWFSAKQDLLPTNDLGVARMFKKLVTVLGQDI